MQTKNKKLKPIHPGQVLLEEFLKPMNLSQNRLALDMRVPARRINEIVHGKRRVTPDIACDVSGTSTCLQNSGSAYKWITISM